MKRPLVQTPEMARTFLLGVFALTALAWPAEVVAQGVKATVLSIGDGDTIRVRQAGKALTVRLACIDAPETAQSPYGQQARTYLQQRLPIGREVSLNLKTTDRYGWCSWHCSACIEAWKPPRTSPHLRPSAATTAKLPGRFSLCSAQEMDLLLRCFKRPPSNATPASIPSTSQRWKLVQGAR